MTTPKLITYIVVGSLALMSIIYVGTLAFCVISGNQATGDAISSFKDAGIYVLGGLTGCLVNTRSQSTEEKK